MKLKLLIIATISLLFVGCATTIDRVKVAPQAVPLLVCPTPPAIVAPRLMIEDLTEADRTNPDKVAKAYKGSLLQLKLYSEQLGEVLREYAEISQRYAELRKQLLLKYPELQQTNPELFE